MAAIRITKVIFTLLIFDILALNSTRNNTLTYSENYPVYTLFNTLLNLWSVFLGDRKREGVASSSLIPPKKSKLGHSSSVVSGGVVRSSPVTTPDNSDTWEIFALEFDPADFITLISDASNTNDHDKIVS